MSHPVLTLIPHRGAYVRTLTRREVTEVLVIQETLTALVTRLATEHIADGENRQLFNRVYNELIANTSSADIHVLLDRRAEFYDTLVTLSGNSELKRFVPIPQTNLLRTQFVRHFSREERQRELQEYSQIAKHVLNGAASLAENAMRLHIKNSRLSIERLPDDAFAATTETFTTKSS